jgi:hypothetical protein
VAFGLRRARTFAGGFELARDRRLGFVALRVTEVPGIEGVDTRN